MDASPGPSTFDETRATDGYLFWTGYTAAQAVNFGRTKDQIGHRVRRFFHDVCRAVDPTTVLELGAHEGRFSRWAKREFPEARCLALEANPHVHAKFQERMKAAGVDYRHLAAASTNGTVTINIPTQLGESTKSLDNRMASLAIHRNDVAHQGIEVEAVRVDDLVQLGEDDRVVLWVDVEGANDAVLEGGREVLARADAVYIEVESVAMWPGQWLDLDVARFLMSLGMVPAMRDVQRTEQYNVVFLSPRLARRDDLVARAAAVLRPARPPADDPTSG